MFESSSAPPIRTPNLGIPLPAPVRLSPRNYTRDDNKLVQRTIKETLTVNPTTTVAQMRQVILDKCNVAMKESTVQYQTRVVREKMSKAAPKTDNPEKVVKSAVGKQSGDITMAAPAGDLLMKDLGRDKWAVTINLKSVTRDQAKVFMGQAMGILFPHD